MQTSFIKFAMTPEKQNLTVMKFLQYEKFRSSVRELDARIRYNKTLGEYCHSFDILNYG